MASPEVIIVGAGVVGSALAARVALIERTGRNPIGIVDCIEGIDAIRVDGYAVFRDDEEVLREAAKSTENVQCIEGTLYAPLTIVVDGCSQIPKEYITKELRLEKLRLPLPTRSVVLAKPSPILLYQIGTEERDLVDVPGKLPSQANGELKNYMRDSWKSFHDALATERLRCHFVGDSMNMRHPLTGGGMTVGLWMRSNLKALQAACFGYFKLGGNCVAVPVGLLQASSIPQRIDLPLFRGGFLWTWLILKSEPFYMVPEYFEIVV
ncbi:squalene epoxidase-domain-containing protein, partial [Chytridium lagenaria]